MLNDCIAVSMVQYAVGLRTYILTGMHIFLKK
jgi:hypothetical protein